MADGWRNWWVFYIDPTDDSNLWRTAGMIGGPFTADEAIQRTVGRRFPQRNAWAFALDKGDFAAYYDLHGSAPWPCGRPLGPSGYVAEGSSGA